MVSRVSAGLRVAVAVVVASLAVGCGNVLVGDSTTPPAVSIESPENEEEFQEDESIPFEANVTDPNDNDRIDSLVWRSELSGRIGEGTSFTSTLEAGEHTIQATAFDDEGGDTTDVFVTISVLSSS